ncbi:hypothetical protein HY993_00020 [Candidatus Micrarchaeota archaeon]|nr:hypothetical protein [Candidatus Micrarchaeota archaeon]
MDSGLKIMLLTALSALVAGGLVAAVILLKAQSNSNELEGASFGSVEQAKNLEPITSGTTGNGDVEISLTPKSVGGGQIVFSAALNTHSVDLSQISLKQAMALDIGGKRFFPSSAPVLSGHHVNGQIVFSTGGASGPFQVTITGIPVQKQRVFKWS